MSKRKCPLCSEIYKNKKDYVEHLKDEFENASYEADIAYQELEAMGVTEFNW